MHAQRNIGLAILFSILTCGLYMLYWLYKISEETRALSPQEQTWGSPGLDLLLEIVTCGIFGYFVVYQSSKRLYAAELKINPHASDDSVLMTVVGIFGWIIALAILQSKLNNLYRVSGNTAQSF